MQLLAMLVPVIILASAWCASTVCLSQCLLYAANDCATVYVNVTNVYVCMCMFIHLLCTCTLNPDRGQQYLKTATEIAHVSAIWQFSHIITEKAVSGGKDKANRRFNGLCDVDTLATLCDSVQLFTREYFVNGNRQNR